MSEQQQFKQPWNIFQHAKLRLTGEPWSDGKGRPSLQYTVHNNNPRFRLYMNDGGKGGPIPFSLDPYIIEQILDIVENISRHNESTRTVFDLKSSFDHRGNKTDKPASVAKIIIGRDQAHCVYIAFQAKGEQMAKFIFAPNFYGVTILDATNEPMDKAKVSEICARAWVRVLRGLTESYMVVHGKEPKEKPGSGKGYSGGGNKGGWGGNKGGGKEESGFDDNWSNDDVGF